MSRPVIKLPEPKVRMKLAELTEVQGIAARHISFSLTLACPLRCSHCIVDAAGGKRAKFLPVETARRYADQMAELHGHGIRSVGFTGGEPLLASRQLTLLSDAAHRAGIRASAVTSAYWAETPAAARETIRRYPGVREWHISTDVYHQEFVGLDWIQNAYEAALDQGRCVTIRFAYIHDPLSPEEQRILEFITTLEEASFSAQRIRSVGRGADLGIGPSHRYNPWCKPCMTQGMLIRYDGTIAPCCLNLVEARNHPFQLGSADARPLKEIHRDYMSLPLLQLIRGIGFSQAMDWLKESPLARRIPDPLPDEICEICTILMCDPEMARFLVRKVSPPETQLKIALLTRRMLNEPHMLRSVLREFPHFARSIPKLEEWTQTDDKPIPC